MVVPKLVLFFLFLQNIVLVFTLGLYKVCLGTQTLGPGFVDYINCCTGGIEPTRCSMSRPGGH